jgi:hypothetical protein
MGYQSPVGQLFATYLKSVKRHQFTGQWEKMSNFASFNEHTNLTGILLICSVGMIGRFLTRGQP